MVSNKERMIELNYVCTSSPNSEMLRKDKKKLLGLLKILYLVVILGVIIISFIPTFVNVNEQSKILHSKWMLILNCIVFTVLFIDYLLRWITYPVRSTHQSKFSYLFFPFTGLSFVMLLALIPTLLAIISVTFNENHIFLQVVNVLSVTKILRLLMLLSIMPSFATFINTFSKEKYLLINIFIFVIVMVFIFALIIYSAEGKNNDKINNYWDALYFTFITITTIGYGDITPQTPIGRAVVIVVALLGIILLAIPTGIITGTFVYEFHRKYRKNSEAENKKKQPTVERIFTKIKDKQQSLVNVNVPEVLSVQIILSNIKDKNYNSSLYQKLIESLGGEDNIKGSEFTKEETFIIDIKNRKEINDDFYKLTSLFNIGIVMNYENNNEKSNK